MNLAPALAVERGCGRRVKGGIYAECGMSPFGRPVEEFLFDPPVVVDKEAMGLTEIGVSLVKAPKSEIYFVFDIIGAQHYPNVADFVEEVRHYGMSRRLPSSLDFSRITRDSMHILLHARGWINGVWPYWRAYLDEYVACMKIPEHTDSMCASLWWQDIEGGDPDPKAVDVRQVVRCMPSFNYRGAKAPASEQSKPGHEKYSLAMVARFPINRIVVVEDPDGGTHIPKYERAKSAGVPVEFVDA